MNILQNKIEPLLQKELYECGYLSLIMILDFFGHKIEIDDFEKNYTLSTDGATFDELSIIANDFGLLAEAYKVSQKNTNEIITPAIWYIYGSHFVVIEKIDNEYIYIIDPSSGRKKVNKLELNNYTGFEQPLYILEFKKLEHFIEKNTRTNFNIKDIINSIDGIKSIYIDFLLLAILYQAIIIFTPMYVQISIDNVISNNNLELLWVLVIGFSFLYSFDILIKYLKEYILINTTNNLKKKLLQELHLKLLNLKYTFFKNKLTASIINKYNALEKITKLISKTIPLAMLDFISIISMFIVMLFLNIKLTFIVIAISSLFLFVRYFNYKRNLSLWLNFWDIKEKEDSTLLDIINNIKTIKQFNIEPIISFKYFKVLHNRINIELQLDNVNNKYRSLSYIIIHLDTLVVIFLGTKMILDKTFTVGMLYSFVFFKNIFSLSFSQFIDRLIEILISKSEVNYLKDIYKLKINNNKYTILNSKKVFSDIYKNASIKFNNLYFKQDNKVIINNLNYFLNKRESLCIYGKSGTGKSTLLRILSGLYEDIKPKMIYIDNIDISYIPKKYLRSRVSFMDGSEEFFNGTIVENITLFDKSPNIERAISILKNLELFDIITNNLVNGIWEHIKSINNKFSSGQKKRLLIARAIYKNSDIMILDEPTSNLDQASEKLVIEYILSLNKRVIISTHSKQVLKYFNNILELK